MSIGNFNTPSIGDMHGKVDLALSESPQVAEMAGVLGFKSATELVEIIRSKTPDTRLDSGNTRVETIDTLDAVTKQQRLDRVQSTQQLPEAA